MEDISLASVRLPDEPVGFKVVVSPSNLVRTCWHFVILLDKADRPIAQEVVKEICNTILDTNDQYSMYPVTPEDADDLDGVLVPTLAHDLNSDEFIWLYPPNHIKH